MVDIVSLIGKKDMIIFCMARFQDGPRFALQSEYSMGQLLIKMIST